MVFLKKISLYIGLFIVLFLPRAVKAGDKVLTKEPATKDVSYEQAFIDLYDELGKNYPCFELKNIDWKAVGEKLIPQVKKMNTDEEFGELCLKLVARLEDSHSYLMEGTAKLPQISLPRWDPGIACLIDDREKPVVFHVDRGSPAEEAGVEPGMTVKSVNGKPAKEMLKDLMTLLGTYHSYSSRRNLRYHVARFFLRQKEQGTIIDLVFNDVDGKPHSFQLPATLESRYLPRLPVPKEGIPDSANVSWKMLDEQIGYIYVRRIRRGLIQALDRAVGDLQHAVGLIIDIRGNSGGGFDGRRALLNFDLQSELEPHRPRYKGSIALLTDPGCISAGEGWASWFIADERATIFGETTAGASSSKKVYTLKNGLYKVKYSVRPRRGFLRRPIEHRGLEPTIHVRQNAKDLAKGQDTVLNKAKDYLLYMLK